ncbi:MAG: ATP-grasp fold amidoligase family protein [Lachnospiraceae bacterium]|nr:ATP-grasp fold amidoligase family protein [Lachnospiraceae bacterium]
MNNPKTINDKVLWLKFNTYWNNQLIKDCADKYRVREYIEAKGHADLLNELLGVYEKPEEIDWDSLPNEFVIKLNVGCGCNLVVGDKSKLNIEDTIKTMNSWFKVNHWITYSEMQYKGIKSYIIIEKYLGNPKGEPPVDYKFYCMNGKANSVMVCEDRGKDKKPKFFFMDKDWNKLPLTEEVFLYPDFVIEKPAKIDEAFSIAEKLSEDFPFVRVDLFIVDDRIYFGELTFTPSAGLDEDFKFIVPGEGVDTDTILGRQLVLP